MFFIIKKGDDECVSFSKDFYVTYCRAINAFNLLKENLQHIVFYSVSPIKYCNVIGFKMIILFQQLSNF